MGYFLDAIGDRPVDTYSKSDARAYKAHAAQASGHWVKYGELQGLPFARAAEKSQELGLEPMTESNVNKLLGFVGSFWTWAADQYDEVPVNPFRGLKIKQRKRVRDERDPFSLEELRAIFNAPIYTGCASLRSWKEPGNLVPRNSGMFWVPLISLFSGARMGEIIQLYVEDVREEDGILFFDINDNGDDKRLKTPYSKRSIPIHASILDMGFMDHVNQCRHKGLKRLFPTLPGRGWQLIQPFSKPSAASFGPSHHESQECLPQLRHSFEDACRTRISLKEIMDALQGHGQEGMYERYGRATT
jgi:integrase